MLAAGGGHAGLIPSLLLGKADCSELFFFFYLKCCTSLNIKCILIGVTCRYNKGI